MAYLSRFVVSCASDLVGSQDLKVYQFLTNQSPKTKVVSIVAYFSGFSMSLSFLSNALMPSKRTVRRHQHYEGCKQLGLNFGLASLLVSLR